MGALLQNRLVASLTSQASIRSAGLPAPVREHFVSGFRQSRGQRGADRRPCGFRLSGRAAGLGGTRGAVAPARRRVFTNGYVLAMRWTMLMPIAVVVLAAASCFAIKNQPGQDRIAASGADSGQMAGTISSPGSLGSSGHSPGSSSGTAS